MEIVNKRNMADWNEHKNHNRKMSKHLCMLRYGLYSVVSRADAVCDSYACQHIFQFFVAYYFKIPGSALIFWQAFSTCICNTYKTLIDSKESKALRCPHSQKFRGLCKPVDWPARPINCPPMVRSVCCLTGRRKWGSTHHAWTTSFAIGKAAYLPTVLVNH